MNREYNAIMLIFDTLRPDYLGCYGSNINTVAFDSAADQGVVFESAFGAAPGTPISHASLYSGQYPSEHGVTGGYINLPGDIPVIAEWFQKADYDTFGITGPAKMGSDWGYDRGFDELFEHYYDLPSYTSWKTIAKSITDRRFAKSFIRKLVKGGSDNTRYKFELLEDKIASELDSPFFALCNFTTVHAPYDPPRPYKEQATSGFSRPRIHLVEHLLDSPGTIDDPDIRLDRVLNVQTADGVGRYLGNPDYLNEKEIRFLRDWYAASVKYLNDEFSRFLEFYRRELQDDTVLVLTADHGEQLGEHGLLAHSHYLYDETLNVPLIIVGPNLPAEERRSDLVSHVDVFDTLCDLCNLDSPDTTSGNSLFAGEERTAVFMEYGESDIDDFANKTSHGRYLDRDQLREFTAGRKAIRSDKYRFEIDSNGTERLFKLPQQIEVLDAPAHVTARLRERLLETLGDEFGIWPADGSGSAHVNKRVKENLRKLGYID